ncbi:hypothetical protein GTW43_32585 [Streptomyces sp. SID5785]|uniref:hypothetical protein n=1 Tax=Streptomyces sp. SID5785 TaxID=2690309 RepID=UPI001361D8C5|nr:hypothetical protein [Streptomyces sp. SID5785]
MRRLSVRRSRARHTVVTAASATAAPAPPAAEPPYPTMTSGPRTQPNAAQRA